MTDYASILSNSTIVDIEKKLEQHEKKTSNQVVVLTIPSLERENLEQFSLKVAQSNAVGQKGKDNGVLLLISKNDRKLRIEVGYGLEGALTDLRSSRIINKVIVPKFKNGNFDDGVETGVEAILSSLEGSYDASDYEPAAWHFDSPLSGTEQMFGGFFIIGIYLIFAIVGVLNRIWFMYFFLAVNPGVFILIIFGSPVGVYLILCHLIGFPILAKKYGKEGAKGMFGTMKPSGSRGSSGWSGGSSSSSWSSSSSSSSSSFSGGGGSFGGGGSSGSW